jgi:hypothetical protein
MIGRAALGPKKDMRAASTEGAHCRHGTKKFAAHGQFAHFPAHYNLGQICG